MQIQTACCVLLNTYQTSTISTWPWLEPFIFHVAISTYNDYIEGFFLSELWRLISAHKLHLEIFWKSTHAVILNIYCITQCPRFHETCKEKKNWADTRDHISYSSVFSPSVSGRILWLWIINSLSAFDLYSLSLLTNYMRNLSFVWADSFNSISALHLAWV